MALRRHSRAYCQGRPPVFPVLQFRNARLNGAPWTDEEIVGAFGTAFDERVIPEAKDAEVFVSVPFPVYLAPSELYTEELVR